jgi:hypothetical protein
MGYKRLAALCAAGGADGKILQWDVSDGSMAEGKFAAPSITLEHPYGTHCLHAVVASW